MHGYWEAWRCCCRVCRCQARPAPSSSSPSFSPPFYPSPFCPPQLCPPSYPSSDMCTIVPSTIMEALQASWVSLLQGERQSDRHHLRSEADQDGSREGRLPPDFHPGDQHLAVLPPQEHCGRERSGCGQKSGWCVHGDGVYGARPKEADGGHGSSLHSCWGMLVCSCKAASAIQYLQIVASMNIGKSNCMHELEWLEHGSFNIAQSIWPYSILLRQAKQSLLQYPYILAIIIS